MNTDAPRPNISPSAPDAMSAAIAHHHQRVDISPPATSSSSIHQQESSSLKSSSLEKDMTKCAPRSRSSSASSSHGSAASVPSRIGALPSTSSTGTKKDEEKTLTQPDDKEDVPETENAPSSSVPPCTHANEMLTSSSSSSSLASSGAGTGATAATILAPRKRELHYFSDQYRGWLNLLLNEMSDSETDNDDDDEMDAEQEQEQEQQQQQQQQEEEETASVEYTETLQHQARRGSYRASHEEGALAVAANIVASMMDYDDDEQEAPAMLPQ